MNVNDVIQFNENHKWRGCLGIIRDIKRIYNPDPARNKVSDIRYMVGVPSPMQGTAFIYVMESENAIEYIGEASLILKDGEDNEWIYADL